MIAKGFDNKTGITLGSGSDVSKDKAIYDASDSIDGILDISYNAYGYTKELKKSERFEETNTPYIIQEKGGDAIRFSKGLVKRNNAENIHLPLAPFADGSTDELLSHSDNGFETQVDHKAGDIIHCGDGAELVSNGTFDSDVDGWEAHNADISSESGKLKVDDSADSGGNSCASQSLSLVAGVKYLIRVDLIDATDTTYVQIGSSSSKYETLERVLSLGDNSFEFTADDKSTNINLVVANDKIAYFDNISVKPVEQTYQSLVPTTSGDLVTDGTRFSKIDFVSRQDVIFIGEDGKYKTIKGYHNFPAGFSADDVANAYGFTKKGKGLFEVNDLECVGDDGVATTYTGEITSISLVSRLNAGAYHPAHNAFGTSATSETDDPGSISARSWYSRDAYNITSTYETFETCELEDDVAKGSRNYRNYINESEDNSYRPDKKHCDKVYFEGLGGLIFRNTLAIKPNKKDLLEDETNELVDVDEMNEECGVRCKMIKGNSAYLWGSNNGKTNEVRFTGLVDTSTISIGTGLSGYYLVSGTVHAVRGTVTSMLDNSWVTITVDSGLTNGNTGASDRYGVDAVLTTPLNQLLQQGKVLTIDVVGNPAKYSISDSPDELHSDSTDSGELLRHGALCWNVDTNKMYIYLDTDDRDNVDMTAEDFNDVAKYKYVIGRYPDSWHNRLDSGLSLPFNPLLVGQEGKNYIPRDISNLTILSKKSKQYYLLSWNVKDSDKTFFNRGIYPPHLESSKVNHVLQRGTFKTNMVSAIFYHSLPTPTTQSDPKQVLMVSDKVLASNSLSWYQGGGIVNAVTGKVSVGNNEITEVNSLNGSVCADGSIKGKLGHSTINLDNSNSPAAKAFTTLCVDDNDELLIGLVGEEIVWDFEDGTPHTFISWDKDDDEEITLVKNSIYVFIPENPNGTNKNRIDNIFANRVYRYIGDGMTINRNDVYSLKFKLDNGGGSNFGNMMILPDGTLMYTGGAKCINFELWGGNGFGDNRKFNQLANGTVTDLNGNAVRTYNGFKRTGYYI